MKPYRSMLVWVGLILLVVVLYRGIEGGGPASEVSFTEFIHKATATKDIADKDRIDEITVHGNQLEGTTKGGKAVKTTGDLKEFQKDLIATGVQITYEREDAGAFWVALLSTWLPMLLLLGLFFFFMRQIQSGGTRAMSFGKSKAKMMTEATNKVTFDDVAGIDECKQELEEIIHFLKDPKKFTKLGGRIPKGVLLMGPPGTGKTLLARAVAGEAGVPFFSISGSDFVEMFVGVGASRVRDLFEQGKKSAPCIIFIDEIDAVGRHRGAGMGGGHDEREQTLNQLLVEMDGFENNSGVILMAATNRPDVLDPALLRAGRFDRRVVVPAPDSKGRLAILKVHTRKVPLGPDVDLEVLARGTPGMAGADLENLVNEAALIAARRDKETVAMADFDYAKDKVLMGPERRSAVMSEDEKRNTAFHEAGHAVVALTVPKADPIHKATIIFRGRALGMVQQLPERDAYSKTKQQFLSDLAICFGGRVAEEMIFGPDNVTTGAASDMQQATRIARAMVTAYGMSAKLGRVRYQGNEQEVFLGHAVTNTQHVSEATAQLIDEEVLRLVSEGEAEARRILTERNDALHRVAEALLEYETLDAEEIAWAVDGKDLKELHANREAQAKHRQGSSDNKPEPKKPATPLTDTLPGLPEPLPH